MEMVLKCIIQESSLEYVQNIVEDQNVRQIIKNKKQKIHMQKFCRG